MFEVSGSVRPPAIRSGKYKLIGDELDDLENDPHETKNLASDPAHAAKLARHRQRLEDWIKATDDKGQYPEYDKARAAKF